jgi:hypothetical protein
MHHLVQQRVLDLGPTVPGDVPAAQGELHRPAGPNVHRELAQPAAHAAGEPDRDLSQCTTEMLRVQLPVPRFQPMQQKHVSGMGTIATPWSRCRGRVLLHREPEKLTLRRSTERSRNLGIQEPYDGLEHSIRSGRVAPMNSENPPAETEHHRSIGLCDDPVNVSEAELLESERKLIL